MPRRKTQHEGARTAAVAVTVGVYCYDYYYLMLCNEVS